MTRKRVLAILLLFLAATGIKAQNVSDLIISEVLPCPDSTGRLDGYGRRSPWVEIMNTSTGTVNFGGCFLTDDRNNLKKSLIPKWDRSTKVGPRQVVLIWASGNSSEGTYYAGIRPEAGKTIYLVSNDGRTIIDSLTIPVGLPAGKSVQKMARDLRQMEFEACEEAGVPSPASPNGNQDSASKAQQMAISDPHGFTLAVVSIAVVFCALAILWFLFWLLFERRAARKAAPAAKRGTPDGEVAAAIALALDMEESGDDYAAIAAALHLYLSESVHDLEPGFVTIRRTPSGWDNKALGFRKLPKE
ncbi:MAG: lamin tail domain-containing protein [Bacteroidales bacterium]|nr:lamin tail domain-containing protein [Bacteroidales bacterium]